MFLLMVCAAKVTVSIMKILRIARKGPSVRPSLLKGKSTKETVFVQNDHWWGLRFYFEPLFLLTVIYLW